MGEKYHYKDYIKSLKKKLVYKIAKGGAINKRKSKKLEKTLIKRNYIDELKAISQSNKSEEEFKDDLNEIVKKYPESRELIQIAYLHLHTYLANIECLNNHLILHPSRSIAAHPS